MNIEQLRKRPISVTMKVDEKVAYARDIYPMIFNRVMIYLHKNFRKLRNMQHYPYTIVKECPMGNRGTWLIAIEITKVFGCDFNFIAEAFYPFVVTNAKKPENNGLGFFRILPRTYNANGTLVGTYEDSRIDLDEFAPHVLNRMIQRGGRDLLKNNISQICRHLCVIMRNSIYSKTIIREESYGVQYNRVVIGVENGQMLGIVTLDNDYTCIKTYISENEMKPSQKVLNKVLMDIHGKDIDANLNYLMEKYDFDTIMKINELFKGKDEKVRLDKIWNEIMGANAL